SDRAARTREPAVRVAEPTAFATADEGRVEHRLEPLKPRPRRKWILFGPYQRRGGAAEGDNEAGGSLPKVPNGGSLQSPCCCSRRSWPLQSRRASGTRLPARSSPRGSVTGTRRAPRR